ncbi:MLV-related proviral Env polyprotein-like [Notechis scutatus]|uniref:MLV-related proviral Env polyprotein-like n=1 Tax=Notechis scutatus TaxID=8663 RepID=A0A6J1VCL0_9SAUR|nr:MLV-related proviral Env polyprotein-like [Notechis scutatus]
MPAISISLHGYCDDSILWDPPANFRQWLSHRLSLICHICNNQFRFQLSSCPPLTLHRCTTAPTPSLYARGCFLNASMVPQFSSIPAPARHHRSKDPQLAHRSFNITWTIKDTYGQILNSTSNYTQLDSYFPSLHFDLAEMILGQTAHREETGSLTPNPQWIQNTPFYVCPGHDSIPAHIYMCGGVADCFCKSWSCVSTGQMSWSPPYKNDLIIIHRTTGHYPSCHKYAAQPWNRCNPVTITFTNAGKSSKEWDTGVKWGGRMHASWPGYHYGNVFYIQRYVSLLPSPPLGPNADQIQSSFLQPLTNQQHPLLGLLSSSYQALNSTNSTPFSQCWLCVSSIPPFYEAIGSIEPIVNATNDSSCRWRNSSLTITSVIGQGCCLGNIPQNYSQYCANATTGKHLCDLYLPQSRNPIAAGYTQVFSTVSGANITLRLKGQYFIPGNNSLWACSTGLTACVHGDELVKSNSFCIQVQLLPKIDVYTSDDFISILEPHQYHLKAKREIVTALTLSVLLGLGAMGASTGIAALAVNQNQLHQLSATIDEDLRRIETSIVALQNSLTSLSEVVIQNRRGLDLLYLKQGGLCAALKEECCFYADSSGIVLDSMKELDKRLKERELERSSQYAWYQGLFSWSPWLTTLLSALIGPIILLILLCTIGPCVGTRLLKFVKKRLAAIDTDINMLVNMRSGDKDEQLSLLAYQSKTEDESDTPPDQSYGKKPPSPEKASFPLACLELHDKVPPLFSDSEQDSS